LRYSIGLDNILLGPAIPDLFAKITESDFVRGKEGKWARDK
jgi:hypothetical protein